MNIQVRARCFETNSSSTHAIVLGEDGERNAYDERLYVDENGVLEVFTAMFEWEWREYRDAATKASYVLTFLRTCIPGGERVRYAEEQGREFEERFVRVLKAGTDAREVRLVGDPPSTHYPYGDIDHQSEAVLQWSRVLESDETLHRFIFDSRSVLVTGNDNEWNPLREEYSEGLDRMYEARYGE